MRRKHLLAAIWTIVGACFVSTLVVLIRSTSFQRERKWLPVIEPVAAIAATSTPVVTSGPKDADGFVEFENNQDVDGYPWQHVHYGRWRRRVIVPGHVDADRPMAAGPEGSELNLVLRRAISLVQNRTGDPGYRPTDCLGGRVRHLPGVGTQYEVYLRVRVWPPPSAAPAAARAAAPAAAAARRVPGRPLPPSVDWARIVGPRAAAGASASAYAFHTVRLQRALGPLEVEYAGRVGGPLVHVVLPYYNQLAALEAFVARFRRLALQLEEVALTVVRFSEGLPAMSALEEREDRARAAALLAELEAALAGVGEQRVRMIETEGTFSLSAGWLAATGSMVTQYDIILLFVDVNMMFGQNFLHRCRANTRPGEAVYYPAPFSTYNPEIVYGVIKKKVIPVEQNYAKNSLIHQDLGYWLDTDYSISCQYLSDFRRFSAAFEQRTGSNFEILMYERFVKSRLEVVRIPDPDLVQVYRRMTCVKEMGREAFNKCLKKKAMNEASRLEWGLWVYKNMGDTDEVQKFLDIVKTYNKQVPGGG